MKNTSLILEKSPVLIKNMEKEKVLVIHFRSELLQSSPFSL